MHTKAVDRCRKAYLMNGIPWDEKIGRQPTVVLDILADCWERRARGDTVNESCLGDFGSKLEPTTIRECKQLIDRVARPLGVSMERRTGYRHFLHSQLQYNGFGGRHSCDE
jgi:hypothetical protein